MKKIKLLFISLIIMFISFSCNESIEKVSSPEKTTTLEILEVLPKDSTYVIAMTDEKFYLINEKTKRVDYILYDGKTNSTIALLLFIVGIVVGSLVTYGKMERD